MKNNYDTFLSLATRVAALHDSTEKQKELYVQWRKRVLGSQGEPKISFDDGIGLF